MFTTVLTVSLATFGLFSGVGDASPAEPICCMKHAYCCSVQRSCCPKAETTNVEVEQAMAASGEVAKAICCTKRAYCCSVKRSCCPKTEANSLSAADRAELLLAGVTAKPICCMKRAYCCSVNRPCCRGAAMEMAVA